ncbi:hypothetical protein SLEP1_g43732 [Rubroshorea leprosula]|uniref:Uncharacterized protein n=1 Tax=Rubroshorea leprosula TaxID=152421 RepID=A0AAV5LEY9_9ROSI|nr:hypothetical protein SLEP1_g43732 [Rubroshorea leprosula]
MYGQNLRMCVFSSHICTEKGASLLPKMIGGEATSNITLQNKTHFYVFVA